MALIGMKNKQPSISGETRDIISDDISIIMAYQAYREHRHYGIVNGESMSENNQ